jgi:hypothetical protein
VINNQASAVSMQVFQQYQRRLRTSLVVIMKVPISPPSLRASQKLQMPTVHALWRPSLSDNLSFSNLSGIPTFRDLGT